MAEGHERAGPAQDGALARGTGLVHAVVVGTGLLVATSLAAAASPDRFQTLHAAYSCVLFAIGTGAMVWAFALGVSRSRTDDVDVLGLFLLAGDVAPVAVRRRLRGSLVVQVVAVVVAAAIHPFTPVAFGVLAPMFGLGMMGVWGGQYGAFSPASRVGQTAPMPDQATETMEIAASPERVRDVLLDFDAYPSWARDLKGVTVESTDADGRAREVTFRAAAMGRSTSYTLRYEYGDDPTRIDWELVRGDIMRKLDGSYVLEPAPDGRGTHVTYHLSVDLIIPLPGFVKRRAETKIVHTALRELRGHVEG